MPQTDTDIIPGQHNKMAEGVLNPIVDKLSAGLGKLIEKMSVKIEDLLDKDGAWSLLGREMYGAMRRVGAQKGVKNLVRVSSLEGSGELYHFSRYSPLDFPEIVDKTNRSGDKDEKVKTSKGFPANNNVVKMIKVDVSWPYSRGWMFPVVSGYGKAEDAQPVCAKGHALVFPQPNISNDNLKSVGAVEYAEGGYTNLTIETFGELMGEMTNYLRRLQFAFRYRIGEEQVSVFCHHTHQSSTPYWGIQPAWDWLFNPYDGQRNEYAYHKASADKHKVNDLYAKNWKALTENASYDAWKNKDGYEAACFAASSYHAKQWMYWPDTSTHVYRYPVLDRLDNVKAYHEEDAGQRAARVEYLDQTYTFDVRSQRFVRLYYGEDAAQAYAARRTALETRAASLKKYLNDVLKTLVRKEIAEIDNLLAGGGADAGSDIIPKDSKEFIEDPKRAQEEAKKKYAEMQNKVDAAFRTLNAEVGKLRDYFTGEVSAALDAYGRELRQARSELGVNLARGQAYELMPPGDGSAEEALGAFLRAIMPNRANPVGALDRLEKSLAALEARLKTCYKKEIELGEALKLNAVDSAALAHATWQARGMNAIQNLNEEKYLALDLANTLTHIGLGTEVAAQAAYATSLATSFFPPAAAVLKAAAGAFRVVSIVTACTGGYLAHVVCKVLDVFQYIFCYTLIAGLINAENFAYYNGAFNLGGFSLNLSKGNAFQLNLTTVPLTKPFSTLFKLPVERVAKTEKPWQNSLDKSAVFGAPPFVFGRSVFELFNAGKPWEVKPFVSQKKGEAVLLPPPSVWIAFRLGGQIESLPLDVISATKCDKIENMPIFAIAAGQCITGDVVAHVDNKTALQRPIGFGTGATAKLVPVSEAVADMGLKTLSKFANGIIFH